MINLIIADDHPIYLDGLKTALSDVPDISIVGEAMNGKQVLDLLKKVPADIVLLDINMPEMDGIDTAWILKNSYAHIKIIMLTQFGEKKLVKKCMETGVEGYLLKDCDRKELIKAIRTIYKGGDWFKFNSLPSNRI